MADYNAEKAFDFAADVVKQFITLAAGIVTITITFSENIIGSAKSNNSGLLLAAWILFAISIIAGLVSLMGITGSLGKPQDASVRNCGDANEQYKGIYRKGICIPAGIQILLFIWGLLCAIWYGYLVISNENPNDDHKDSTLIIHSTEYRLENRTTRDSLDVKANIVIK